MRTTRFAGRRLTVQVVTAAVLMTLVATEGSSASATVTRHGTVGRVRFADTSTASDQVSCGFTGGSLTTLKVPGPLVRGVSSWQARGWKSQPVRWTVQLWQNDGTAWRRVASRAVVQSVRFDRSTRLRPISFGSRQIKAGHSAYRVRELVTWYTPARQGRHAQGRAVTTVRHYRYPYATAARGYCRNRPPTVTAPATHTTWPGDAAPIATHLTDADRDRTTLLLTSSANGASVPGFATADTAGRIVLHATAAQIGQVVHVYYAARDAAGARSRVGLVNVNVQAASTTPASPSGSTPAPSSTPTPPVSVTPTPTPTTTQPATGDWQPSFPINAAFYYPWFPEAWNQQGYNPFTNYHPSLGFYDGAASSVIASHIASMQYAGMNAGIASWWGQGSGTDKKIPLLLNAAAGKHFRWALYYEKEAGADPSVAELQSDLTYIKTHYGSDPSFLRVNGKPVVFVYAAPSDGCGMADRWKQANTMGIYVVLKVFPGYPQCASQPDSWHQYSPAVDYSAQSSYSVSISPGFWKKGDSVRLARDTTRWGSDVQKLKAWTGRFRLVTTFNEWGEGTAVESAQEWSSSSGQGQYLDALHAALGSAG